MRYILTFLLGAVAAGGGYALWDRTRPTTSTEPPVTDTAPPTAPLAKSVVAMGRLVPKSGIVSVTGPASARIVEILVEVGDTVAKSQPLVQLDSELANRELTALQAKLSEGRIQQVAALAAAQAQLKAAQLGVQQAELENLQIDSQREQIDVLEQAVATARETLRKMQEVSNLVPEQKIAQQRLQVSRTEAELHAARNSLTLLERGQSQREAAAQTELELAQANLQKAEVAFPEESLAAELAVAEYQAEQLTVKSPIAGTVLDVSLHAGETIGPRTILDVAALDEMICIAEVYEAEFGFVDLGDEVVIRSLAFPTDASGHQRVLHGQVAQVGRVIARTTLDELDPFQPQDRHVFEVRIRLDEESQKLAGQFVNLQVQVEIDGKTADDR